MTHEQLNSFRCSLDELLAETSATVDRINRSLRDAVPACFADNDRAALESERSMLFVQAKRKRRLKREIFVAFHRMEQGEYGICESCGGSIDLSRLKVNPAARMCVHCTRKIARTMAGQWSGRGGRHEDAKQG